MGTVEGITAHSKRVPGIQQPTNRLGVTMQMRPPAGRRPEEGVGSPATAVTTVVSCHAGAGTPGEEQQCSWPPSRVIATACEHLVQSLVLLDASSTELTVAIGEHPILFAASQCIRCQAGR